MGLASVNDFSRLGGTGTVPSRLVPGPVVLGHVDSGLECDSLIQEVAGPRTGWFGYERHAYKLVELFALSRN